MNNEIEKINPQIRDLQNHLAKDQPKVDSLEDHVFGDQELNFKPELLDNLHQFNVHPEQDLSNDPDQNYIEAFIHNKLVNKVFPDIMNWINILGNTGSFAAHFLGASDAVKKTCKKIGSLSTKAFMVGTSVINIVERCYAKNFVSALGFFNDIIIAGTVSQEDTYLARGTASGTYNMGNSLADSMGRSKNGFDSFDDHLSSTLKAYKKFFKNLFSKNIIQNFQNHKNGMWAILGGLGSNAGALSWLFTGNTKLPTIIRDVSGVLMDIEQLNPGHLKSGRKHFFWSGVTLGIGTLSDLAMRFVSQSTKDLLVPLTFVFDGLGRHLLRLDRNIMELNESSSRIGLNRVVAKPVSQENLHRSFENNMELAA